MDETLAVSAGEQGVVRVFTVDMETSQIARIKSPTGDMPPLGAALGALVGLDWVDPAQAELFDTLDLEELGLGGFLRDGSGVPAAQLDEKAALLDEINGVVLILYSKAFQSEATTLRLSTNVAFVTAFQQERAPIQFAPLPSAAATGTTSSVAPAKANPHLNLLLAVLALPILCLIVGALAWGIFSGILK